MSINILTNWKFQNLVMALGDSLDLRRRGITGKPVGDVIADMIAYSIIRQVDRGLEPDGSRMPPAKRWWVAWKRMHGHSTNLLYMTDEMMNFRQVKGMVVISKDAMSMFYGLSPHAMDKAQWTHEGQHGHGMPALFSSAWGRPPRPFYDLNAQSWKMIDQYIDAEIDAQIMSLGARRI